MKVRGADILHFSCLQLMANCNNGNFSTIGMPSITTIYGANFGGVADCANYYGLLWWSVWLQFFAVVLQIVLVWQCIWPRITEVQTLTLYFFIMSSVLMFGIADQYNRQVYISSKKDGGSYSYTNGASLICAGSIGVSLTLFDVPNLC